MVFDEFDNCLEFLEGNNLISKADVDFVRSYQNEIGLEDHLAAFQAGVISRASYYQSLQQEGFNLKKLSDLNPIKPLVWVKANIELYKKRGILPISESDDSIVVLISNPFLTELSPYLDIKVEKGIQLKFVLISDLEIQYLLESVYTKKDVVEVTPRVKKVKRVPLAALVLLVLFLAGLNINPAFTLKSISIVSSLTVLFFGFLLFIPAFFDDTVNEKKSVQRKTGKELLLFHLVKSKVFLDSVFKTVSISQNVVLLVDDLESLDLILNLQQPFKGTVRFTKYKTINESLIHEQLLQNEGKLCLFLKGNEKVNMVKLLKELDKKSIEPNTVALKMKLLLKNNMVNVFSRLEQVQRNRYNDKVTKVLSGPEFVLNDYQGLIFDAETYTKTQGLDIGRRAPFIFWSILNVSTGLKIENLGAAVMIEKKHGLSELIKNSSRQVLFEYNKLSYLLEAKELLLSKVKLSRYTALVLSTLVPIIYLIFIPICVLQGAYVFAIGLDHITSWWQYLATLAFSGFLIFTVYSNLVIQFKERKGILGLSAWLAPITTLFEAVFASFYLISRKRSSHEGE